MKVFLHFFDAGILQEIIEKGGKYNLSVILFL